MNTIRDKKSKRLIGALVGAAAVAATPALLLVGAGTAHADDPCYEGDFQYSFYCSSGSGALDPAPAPEQGSPNYTPLPNPYRILPGCSYGVLDALDGDCS